MTMRISIVTISFNQHRFLDECIRSVIDQKDPDTEYIVVDPGSTDGSREIIDRHEARLTAKIYEPDCGPADGLNKGFARSSGEILGYVNSDDRLAPGSLAFVREFFRSNPGVDVLCSSIRIIDEKSRAELRSRTPDKFDLANYAAGICTIGQQATFIRRAMFEKVGGFNIVNRICWDGELLVDMAMAGARFARTKRVLGDFRIYPESMTGSGMFASPKYLRERERIVAKMRKHGVKLHSPASMEFRRLAYKFNPFRHVAYMLTR